jgi:hypothetical protein
MLINLSVSNWDVIPVLKITRPAWKYVNFMHSFIKRKIQKRPYFIAPALPPYKNLYDFVYSINYRKDFT